MQLLWMLFARAHPCKRQGGTPNTLLAGPLPLAMREGVSTRCHLPRVGARERSFGSWVGGSNGLGSLGAWGPLFLLTGIGWGSTCLGKPLKNQAPERFHTWGVQAARWHPRLRGILGADLAVFNPLHHQGLASSRQHRGHAPQYPAAIPHPLLLIKSSAFAHCRWQGADLWPQ